MLMSANLLAIKKTRTILLQFIFAPFFLVISACTVGPDFKSPAPPAVERYNEEPIPKETIATANVHGGAAQRFNLGEEIPAEWWELFHSHELNALIAHGFKNSPDLQSAVANLREGEEQLKALIGSTMYPSVDLDIFGGREQLSALDSLEGTPGSVLSDFPVQLLSIYNTNVSVAYVLDVFGGNRRAIESLKAQVDYQLYAVEAVYLTLAGNIATSAIMEASLRGQIKATKAVIELEEKQLDLMRKQRKIGSITDLDIYAQETALAQARALLPPLETNLAQTRHALAVLVGDYPGNAKLPHFELEDLHLPTDLPISVPSTLVKQRPDIRGAEALLHQASANIGVATANLLPSFPITASYGPNSDTLSNFFNASNIAWDWQVNALQTVFNGGALIAERRAAIDAFEAAFADYQSAVLMGLQNVADSLIALDMDAQELKEDAETEKLAKATLDLVQKQYKIGGADYLQVINAEMQYQQAVVDRVTAEAARYADTVALFQSLGGGWWNRSET